MRCVFLRCGVLLVVLFGGHAPCQAQFVENAGRRGIDFVQYNGSVKKEYIVEAKGAGVAVADVNQDGWDDLYFVNGSVVHGDLPSPPPRNELFINRGDGTFFNATDESGLGDEGFGFGAYFADVDHDGDLDCYITNYGPNQLYLNNGDSVFHAVPHANGAQNHGWSTGAAFADINGDGYLDLFVGQYAEFSPELADSKGRSAPFHGMTAFLGPSAFEPSDDNLFINQGDGTFVEATRERGLIPFEKGRAFTAIWSDLDDDADLDLYVANDSTANHLYENKGEGFFEEIALFAGVGLSEDGKEQGGMGAVIRDVDGDQLPDILVTNYQNERNILYKNQGGMQFTDATLTSRFGIGSVAYVGFGLLVEDFDQDGWADAAVFNGHVYPQADRMEILHGYAQPNLYLSNRKGRGFDEPDRSFGGLVTQEGISRGAASGDFDRDGDMDIVVNNLDGEPFFFENISRGGNWIQIAPQTLQSTPAFGSRVTVKTGERIQVQEPVSGSSFLSQNSAVLHFGLGSIREPVQDGQEHEVEVIIRWSDGRIETHTGIQPNQRVILQPLTPPRQDQADRQRKR